MEYYIQVLPPEAAVLSGAEAATHRIWKLNHNGAESVPPSMLHAHEADEGEEIIETLRKRHPGSTFQKLTLAPGEYYPRMARPFDIGDDASPGSNPDDSDARRHARATSTGQLHSLIEQLEQICRVVHPVAQNVGTYGHEIRNLLVIACTEVEAQWKAILDANNYGRGKTTTNDYSKLLGAMKLNEYEVMLNYYPWLHPVRPFEGWDRSDPTKSLRWYHAYNRVKHDRERNFGEAKLIFAIESVAACFVMLCSQYGWDFALRGEESTRAFFQLTGAPTWAASDIYAPPYDASSRAVDYPLPQEAPRRRRGVRLSRA